MIVSLASQAWRRIKPWVEQLSPSAAQLIPSCRMYLRSKKRFGPFQRRMKPLLFGQKTPVILSGPFQGLLYLDEIGFCGPILPKWIGSYECELHGIIEDVLAHPPSLIIDIGSAEGYYSVLLAARLPNSHVVSFDYDVLAVRAQKRLAAKNGVTNLAIKKQCDHKQLMDLIEATKGSSLVICDIEGAEMEMIDPVRCPSLSKADLLVELHEGSKWRAQAMLKELEARFHTSHSITFIPIKPRDPARYLSVCQTLPLEDLKRALDEDRCGSFGWLVLKTLF
jgi:hypothetical protein